MERAAELPILTTPVAASKPSKPAVTPASPPRCARGHNGRRATGDGLLRSFRPAAHSDKARQLIEEGEKPGVVTGSVDTTERYRQPRELTTT